MPGITCSTCRHYRHISRKDYCFKKNKFLSSLDEAKTCNYYAARYAEDKKIREVRGREIEFSGVEKNFFHVPEKKKEEKERELLFPKKEITKIKQQKSKLKKSRFIDTAFENKKTIAGIMLGFFVIVILLILRK